MRPSPLPAIAPYGRCSGCARCRSPVPRRARLLRVEAGTPGLLIERCGFLRDGRPVEYTQSYYRGDTYDFVAELTDL